MPRLQLLHSAHLTLDEARELLGVDGDADERALRRAYLRAVKAHPPERDPEGFARVREAREICLRHLPRDPAAHGLSRAASIQSLERASEHQESPKRSPEEQALLDRCGDRTLSPQQRLESAEQALASMPNEPSAFWVKYAALVGLARQEEALAWLRQGQAKGVDGCLAQIAFDQPLALDDDDVSALLTLTPFPLGLARSLARRAPGDAVGILIEAMEAQAAGDSRGYWAGAALEVILELLAAGDVQAAMHLHARLRLHIEQVGPQVSGGPRGALWLLVRELMDLPSGLTSGLRTRLAQAVLAVYDDPQMRPASARLRVYGAINPRAAEQLRSAAPNLYALVMGQKKALRPRSKWFTYDVQRISTLVVIVVGMFAAHNISDCCARQSRPLGARAHIQDIPILPVGVVDPVQRDHRLAELSILHDRVCHDGKDPVCAELASPSAAVRHDDCLMARLAQENLRPWRPDRRSDRLILGRAITAGCPLPTPRQHPTTTLDASVPIRQAEPPSRTHDEAGP